MRPDFSDFKDIYDAEKLKRDAARLKEKRARIFAKGAFDRSEDLELGEDFEYCLMEAVHERGWFDKSVSVSPGSQYDDMFHGVDLILSFRVDTEDDGEPSYEYLAIDATVAQHPEVLEKKEEEARKNLLNGQMAIVEYFINDDDPKIRGTIRLPEVICALTPADAVDFKNLLGRGRQLSFDDEKRLTVLKNEILARIELQLRKRIEFINEWGRSASPELRDSLRLIKGKHERILQLFIERKKG